MDNNVQNMQIFSIIGEMEDLIENSPRPKMGGNTTRRVIDIAELLDLLGDLKVTIPEDIRRANSVIIESQTIVDNASEHAKDLVAQAQEQADAIISQANANAAAINRKAQEEYERMISEDEIYQEAQRRAQLLAKKAETNAAIVFDNAKIYADDVLRDLENFLGEYKQLVAINRRDLDARSTVVQEPVQEVEAPEAEPVQPAYEPQQNAYNTRKPVEEEYEDEYDDFDDEEEDNGSFFGRLFGKKKKNRDIDFDDEDFDE